MHHSVFIGPAAGGGLLGWRGPQVAPERPLRITRVQGKVWIYTDVHCSPTGLKPNDARGSEAEAPCQSAEVGTLQCIRDGLAWTDISVSPADRSQLHYSS